MSGASRSFTVHNSLFFQIAEVFNSAPGAHEHDELCELADDLEGIPEDGPISAWIQQQFSPGELQAVRDVQASLSQLPTPLELGSDAAEEARKLLYTFAAEFVRHAVQAKLGSAV